MPVTRGQHNRSQGLDSTNDSTTVNPGTGVYISAPPRASRRSSRTRSGNNIPGDKSSETKGKGKGKGGGQSQSEKSGSRMMGRQESLESDSMREDSNGSKLRREGEKEKDKSEEFVFFWKTNEKYGWASQWYYSPFTARIRFEVQTRKSKANSLASHRRSKNPPQIIDSGKAYTFPTAEHYMMASKALLFSDLTIFHQVLSNPGKSQSDLREVKGLGRKVKNFDEDVWVANRREIVLRGNLEKFGGDGGRELRRKLVGNGGSKIIKGDGEEEEGTGEKEIVEASPLDRVWGIGFGEKRALEVGRARWGLNLLGLVLMDVRKILREEEKKESAEGHENQDDKLREEGGSSGIGMDVIMEDATR